MRKVIAGAFRKQKRGSQLGFTLAELIIAVTVTAFIVGGSLLILGHLVIATAENRDETMAALQVQYVSFWISEDVVQAQSIQLSEGSGFPLTIAWQEWDGDENEVTYSVEGEVWTLKREHKVNGESYGATVVGEYLDPDSTRCYWHETSDDVLVLEVTARVDLSEASSTYEIYPRALK